MKLTGFRVFSYRSISDSDFVSLEKLTVIVGKNESGKTSLLKALHKFNSKETFNIDKDWPRGRRKDKNLETIVCTCHFFLDLSELTFVNKALGTDLKAVEFLVSKNYKNTFVPKTPKEIQEAISKMTPATEGAKTPAELEKEILALLLSKIPTFIYMDDYRTFSGNAHLDQVNQRKSQNQLSAEDKTFLTILELSGLTLESELKKASAGNKEERQFDLSDASATLTRDIAERWKQKKYGASDFRVGRFIEELTPAA